MAIRRYALMGLRNRAQYAEQERRILQLMQGDKSTNDSSKQLSCRIKGEPDDEHQNDGPEKNKEKRGEKKKRKGVSSDKINGREPHDEHKNDGPKKKKRRVSSNEVLISLQIERTERVRQKRLNRQVLSQLDSNMTESLGRMNFTRNHTCSGGDTSQDLFFLIWSTVSR